MHSSFADAQSPESAGFAHPLPSAHSSPPDPPSSEDSASLAHPLSSAHPTDGEGLLSPTNALLRGFEPQLDAGGAAFPGSASAYTESRAVATASRQGFRVGGLNMMIGYADGSELTELPPLYRLPHAPGWFAGMANLHGRLVPVFDLARRFALSSPERARPMLLVLAHGADAAGVLIDGLPKRLSFDATNTAADETCVASAVRPFVSALHLIDADVWLDLDVPALLDALEQALAQTPTASY